MAPRSDALLNSSTKSRTAGATTTVGPPWKSLALLSIPPVPAKAACIPRVRCQSLRRRLFLFCGPTTLSRSSPHSISVPTRQASSERPVCGPHRVSFPHRAEPARPRAMRRYAWLAGATIVACSSTPEDPNLVAQPTRVRVSPAAFLGSTPCSDLGGMRLYQATLLDVTDGLE